MYEPAYHHITSPFDRWTFRWGFRAKDGSEIHGSWDGSGRSSEEVPKDDMAFAFIEGKHFATGEVKLFAEKPIHLFRGFQRCAVKVSPMGGGPAYQRNFGMKLNHLAGSIRVKENGEIDE